MKVYFIGAGPGAADLITLRGARILSEVSLVLYAGSLVNPKILSHCKKKTELVDSSRLNLDEQEQYYIQAREKKWDVARLHSGDPAIYGAISEQIQRLEQLQIDYEIIPGVSSFTASAAVLKTELTKPEIAQTIILTRVEGRASPLPERETLEKLAAHQTTLCLFLCGARLKETVETLLKYYSPQTTVVLTQKVTWAEEKIYRGELGNLLQEISLSNWQLTTLLLVGDVLGHETHPESRLYSANYSHRYRKAIK